MSEEKKTHPEHKYSVIFVSKGGTISVKYHQVIGCLAVCSERFITPRTKNNLKKKEIVIVIFLK